MKKAGKRVVAFFTGETFRVTLFVYLFMILMKLVIFNFHIFDQFAQSLKDFDFTDLIYLGEKSSNRQPKPNADIVLINIGQTRQEITEQVAVLEKFHPKVLAIDAWFADINPNEVDSALVKTITAYDNIVLAGFLKKESDSQELKYYQSHGILSNRIRNGYANFISEKENTVRYFAPQFYPGETTEEKKVFAFSASIAQVYDEEKYQYLLRREHPVEYIRYIHLPSDFLRFDSKDIRPENPDLRQLENKIVILGQLGNGLESNVMEDINFTPLNKKISGRSFPDMYGAYIHANILSMILQENYTAKLPAWITWLLSFGICYLHVRWFISFYLHRPMWFHVSTKIIQLFSGVILVGIALLALNTLKVKIELGYILVPVLLSVDCIYFYDGMIKIIHKRWKLNSAFLNAHH